MGPQEAHHFEWELFALSLDSWPQVCRRFTLQVEVPGIPAQDLRAFTVERMVAPIRPTPDGSFLQMCIMCASGQDYAFRRGTSIPGIKGSITGGTWECPSTTG